MSTNNYLCKNEKKIQCILVSNITCHFIIFYNGNWCNPNRGSWHASQSIVSFLSSNKECNWSADRLAASVTEGLIIRYGGSGLCLDGKIILQVPRQYEFCLLCACMHGYFVHVCIMQGLPKLKAGIFSFAEDIFYQQSKPDYYFFKNSKSPLPHPCLHIY